MTITLTHIYRYPIKGLSAESLDRTNIIEGKSMPGDRIFAIENGDSGFDANDPAHLSKIHFLMLMKQPELAALRTRFDAESGGLTVMCAGETLASGNLSNPEETGKILKAIASFCKKPLRGTAQLLSAPDHAFTDARTQDLTLINLASVADISRLAGAELDPIRFRGNLYIEGAKPWQEHDWVGKEITLGSVRFKVRKRTMRCAATNANPETGERDQNIPALLSKTYDHSDCGIHLMPVSDGIIKVGDPLIL
jgi:uncharacterized protein